MSDSSYDPQAGQPGAPEPQKKDKSQTLPSQYERPQAKPACWQPTTTELIPPTVPSPGFVLLLFHGLFCFSCPKDGVCEVGVHTKSPHHDFTIEMFNLPETADSKKPERLSPLKAARPSATLDNIEVQIADRLSPDVKFYITPTVQPIDPLDWRWLPDLEGPHFYYGIKLKKKRDPEQKNKAFDLRLRIKHGVFFTHCLTRSTFRRERKTISGVADNDSLNPKVKSIGNIAFVNGCLITHQADEHVLVKIGSEEYELKGDGGAKIPVVFFKNECPPGGGNDFHLYYKIFNVPAGHEEYRLKLERDGGPESGCILNLSDLGISGFAPGILRDLFDFGPKSTDNTPCGAVGSGQSPSLDEPLEA